MKKPKILRTSGGEFFQHLPESQWDPTGERLVGVKPRTEKYEKGNLYFLGLLGSPGDPRKPSWVRADNIVESDL